MNKAFLIGVILSWSITAQCVSPNPLIDLVEPEVVSTDAIETELSYSPDGTRRLLSRGTGEWGKSGQGSILESRFIDDQWTAFQIASFSGEFDDSDPFFSHDGEYVYFTTDRPNPSANSESRDIWRVPVLETGYGEPEALTYPINSSGDEYSPTLNHQGDLYFASMREGGIGLGDIYVARFVDGEFSTPENLGPNINEKGGEWTVLPSGNDRFLIFEASHRAENVSISGDLYGSLKGPDGWQMAINLRALNTSGSDLSARFINDESRILFASTQHANGKHADIMQASMSLVLSHFTRLAMVSRSNHEVCVVSVPAFIKAGCAKTGGQGPHEIALSPDARFAYVPNHGVYPRPHDEPIESSELKWVNETAQSVSKIDLITMETINVFALNDCTSPHGVVVSHDGSHLWVTCENNQSIQQIDSNTGRHLRTINIGVKGVHEIKLSPDGKLLATANFDDGSVSLISTDGDLTPTTIKTAQGIEGMQFSADGDRLYVSNAVEASISVIDVAKQQKRRDIPTGGKFPIDIALSESGNQIWVSHVASRDITVIDLNSGEQISRIELPSTPLGLIISPDEKTAFVTLPRLNEVQVYDVATRKLIDTISNIMEADGLAWILALNW